MNIVANVPVGSVVRIEVHNAGHPSGNKGRRRGRPRGAKVFSWIAGGGYYFLIVVHIHIPRQRNLPQVVVALDALRLGLGLPQRRKQQTSKNGDHGNNHQKFQKSESSATTAGGGGVLIAFMIVFCLINLFTA